MASSLLRSYLMSLFRLPPTRSLASPPDFQKVRARESHGEYWWQTSGYLLAALLRDAGYTASSQQHILNFFGRAIVPYLGPAHNVHSPQWCSFMTDDHHPIELSWDLHTGQSPPTVRFSIEPVGVHAGTPLDATNANADVSFRQSLLQALPATNSNMHWFHHLDRELAPDLASPGLMEGHPSRIFYAFDLAASSITSKAYFFPGFKARESTQTNLHVITHVIASAPQHTPAQLSALDTFADFAKDPRTPPLEIDMLAVDLDATARLKIYFRTRATSFASVRQMMTLGHRIAHPTMDMDRGLQNLRRLWDALLTQEGIPDDQPLPDVNHRTAGLLYNVELRPGAQPVIKIYIPVRHYASCDEDIISAVHTYMGAEHGYAKTMRRVFYPEALRQRGIHTYIACSVQSGGELRVVSYINCQGYKMCSSR